MASQPGQSHEVIELSDDESEMVPKREIDSKPTLIEIESSDSEDDMPLQKPHKLQKVEKTPGTKPLSSWEEASPRPGKLASRDVLSSHVTIKAMHTSGLQSLDAAKVECMLKDHECDVSSSREATTSAPDEEHHGVLLMDVLVRELICQRVTKNVRDEVFNNLKQLAPTWAAVADAPSGLVVEAIRKSGMQEQKTLQLQTMLRGVRDSNGGTCELAFLFKDGVTEQHLKTTLGQYKGVGKGTLAKVWEKLVEIRSDLAKPRL